MRRPGRRARSTGVQQAHGALQARMLGMATGIDTTITITRTTTRTTTRTRTRTRISPTRAIPADLDRQAQRVPLVRGAMERVPQAQRVPLAQLVPSARLDPALVTQAQPGPPDPRERKG